MLTVLRGGDEKLFWWFEVDGVGREVNDVI